MPQVGASHDVGHDDGGRKEPDLVGASTVSGHGLSVTGGGARSLGRTGGVLSRKDRLQVQFVLYFDTRAEMLKTVPCWCCTLYCTAARITVLLHGKC